MSTAFSAIREAFFTEHCLSDKVAYTQYLAVCHAALELAGRGACDFGHGGIGDVDRLSGCGSVGVVGAVDELFGGKAPTEVEGSPVETYGFRPGGIRGACVGPTCASCCRCGRGFGSGSPASPLGGESGEFGGSESHERGSQVQVGSGGGEPSEPVASVGRVPGPVKYMNSRLRRKAKRAEARAAAGFISYAEARREKAITEAARDFGMDRSDVPDNIGGLPAARSMAVVDVATAEEVEELARQRLQVYKLRNQNEMLKLARSIETEEAFAKAGVNIKRVSGWVKSVESGSTTAMDSLPKAFSNGSRKSSKWSGSWRSRETVSAGCDGKGFVAVEVHEALLAKVKALEEAAGRPDGSALVAGIQGKVLELEKSLAAEKVEKAKISRRLELERKSKKDLSLKLGNMTSQQLISEVAKLTARNQHLLQVARGAQWENAEEVQFSY